MSQIKKACGELSEVAESLPSCADVSPISAISAYAAQRPANRRRPELLPSWVIFDTRSSEKPVTAPGSSVVGMASH